MNLPHNPSGRFFHNSAHVTLWIQRWTSHTPLQYFLGAVLLVLLAVAHEVRWLSHCWAQTKRSRLREGFLEPHSRAYCLHLHLSGHAATFQSTPLNLNLNYGCQDCQPGRLADMNSNGSRRMTGRVTWVPVR